MGSAQSTHIANGYKKHIKGKVAVERELYTRICEEGGAKISGGAISVEISVKTEKEIIHLIQLPGFVKIGSGKFLDFSMSGENGKVYVSIIAGGEFIENFPVRNGENVIVDADGDLRNAMPGEIWKDREGNDHSINQLSGLKGAKAISKEKEVEDEEKGNGIYISSIRELVDALETK